MSGSKIRLYGSTSGYVELEAPAVAPDASLVLPSTFAGIGSNVVQTVKTDTFVTTVNQGAAAAITGLTATITPSSNTAKIFVIAQVVVGQPAFASTTSSIRLTRGGTAIGVGDAAGSRRRETAAAFVPNLADASTVTVAFLDSPATASAVTYGVSISHGRAAVDNVYVNRSVTDTDANNFARYVSTITAIEVAA